MTVSGTNMFTIVYDGVIRSKLSGAFVLKERRTNASTNPDFEGRSKLSVKDELAEP